MNGPAKILRDKLAALTSAIEASKDDNWGHENNNLIAARFMMSIACTNHLATVLDRLAAIEAAANVLVDARQAVSQRVKSGWGEMGGEIAFEHLAALKALVKLATGREYQ